MTRSLLVVLIALAALVGSLVAALATVQARDHQLRGYVDPTRDSNLPYRLPRLGVNVELLQYSRAELLRQIDRIDEAGMTWVRQEFSWARIETEPGVYDWDKYDVLVEAVANRESLELVAVLVDTPAWARTSALGVSETAPPTDAADYAKFAYEFATRYGDTVDFYQVWDEPNLTAAWGMQEPRAADYLALLSSAYTAIHGADSAAVVLAAALAPTTEPGPNNISDLDYLEDLYALGAADFTEGFAAKPYGFNLPPDERTVRNEVLNFSRIVAFREIMLRHGDGTTPLWATQWGWNSLPDSWNGAPSIWGNVTGEQQRAFTLAALERAEREWVWLGGMILYHWQPDAPPDDPVWGFALNAPNGSPTPLLESLTNGSRAIETRATNGLYFPVNAHTEYSGVWTFSELGADIGWVNDSRLHFDFAGRDVAILAREDNYVAYLYPTIDGTPANALPRDSSGTSYSVLTSGSLEPEQRLISIARDLPAGHHTLEIATDRGFDRWAIAGYAVSSGNLAEPFDRQIAAALMTAVVAGVSAVISAWAVDWRRLFQPLNRLIVGLTDTAQLAVSAITSVVLLVGMLLTWGDSIPNILRREPTSLLLAVFTAGLIYIEPGFILTVLAAIALFILFYHRPDLGLALVIFYAPFFLFPVELYQFAFPMSELLMLILSLAWLLRTLTGWGRTRQGTVSQYLFQMRSLIPRRFNMLDIGMLAWLALSVFSLIWTQRRAPAITELRTLIVEPVLFYIILRTTIRDKRTLLRLVDALLLAGIAISVIGLWLYMQGESIITAEEGARRLASVYGSPNNVSLMLGRCIPFALAFILLPVDRTRRLASTGATAVMTLAFLLTLSAGGLLLGLPAAVLAVFVLAWRRRALLPLSGLTLAAVAAFAVALRSARFARIFDFTEGTNFYRIRVWQSAANIIADHPLTGLGLDQFLYAFRGEYILPDAWQEPNLSHPHNFLLDLWVRLGGLGVIVFVALQIAFWRTMYRLYHLYRTFDYVLSALVIGGMGSMVNLLAHGLVDNSVFVNDLAYIFVLLLALAATLSNMGAIDVEARKMM